MTWPIRHRANAGGVLDREPRLDKELLAEPAARHNREERVPGDAFVVAGDPV